MLTHKLNQGRLGNQLFQIASITGIAKKNNQIATFPNLSPLFREWFPLVPTFKMTPTHEFEEYPQNWYRELTFKNDTCLKGYYQSEKYFLHCRDYVLKMLRPQEIYLPKSNYEQTVAVHVRRTDYLHHGWWVGEQYYIKALQQFDPKTTVFCIFSDDIDWCKNFFTGSIGERNYKFIQGLNEYQTLALGMCCDHFIIANSSFSWWMAYFCLNEKKKVYCPDFTIGDFPNKDFYPESWIKISF